MSSGKPHAQVAEDVAFMVEHGETNAEAIATRLGMSIEAVEKAMSRAILAGNLDAVARRKIHWLGRARKRWSRG